MIKGIILPKEPVYQFLEAYDWEALTAPFFSERHKKDIPLHQYKDPLTQEILPPHKALLRQLYRLTEAR